MVEGVWRHIGFVAGEQGGGGGLGGAETQRVIEVHGMLLFIFFPSDFRRPETVNRVQVTL